jgi:hypothetical protein
MTHDDLLIIVLCEGDDLKVSYFALIVLHILEQQHQGFVQLDLRDVVDGLLLSTTEEMVRLEHCVLDLLLVLRQLLREAKQQQQHYDTAHASAAFKSHNLYNLHANDKRQIAHD